MITAAAEFRAGGELRPRDAAFSDIVYREPRQDPALSAALISSSPLVVGSPVLSGKSTLLNLLCDQMARVDSSGEVIEIDCGEPKGMAERELRDLISEALESELDSSFSALVDSRRRATRRFQKSALRFRGVDHLPLSAIRWLLAGIRSYAARPRKLETAGLQILLDGAFTTQTLTSGPDSDFPLSQAFPREFDRRGQSLFFKTRFEAHHIEVTSAALAELHEATSGDKYLTQVVGYELAKELSEGDRIDAAGMRYALAQLVESPTWAYELKRCISKQLRKEKRWFRDLARGMRVEELWSNGSKDCRSRLFKSGLIRRISPIAVDERCQIVSEFFENAFGRLEGVDHLIENSLAVGNVTDGCSKKMCNCIDDIREYAALGVLRKLHCGSGLVVGPGRVHIEAQTLLGESYDGFLEVKDSDLPRGAREVWFIRWTRTTKKQVLKSQLRFWPVHGGWRDGG